MLHIIENFPIQLSFFKQMRPGDTIILKDNAVYAAKQENIKTSPAKRTLAHLNLCVSKADLSLRNISSHELIRGVAIIDSTDEYQEYLTQNIAMRSCN